MIGNVEDAFADREGRGEPGRARDGSLEADPDAVQAPTGANRRHAAQECETNRAIRVQGCGGGGRSTL